MDIVFKENTFCVIDNFLSEEEHNLINIYTQEERYKHVHDGQWTKAFRILDGNPLRGPAYLSHKYEGDQNAPVYPTGKAIDIIFKRILEKKSTFEKWIGKQGKDWQFFFARSYLYSINTGLSWHRDNNYNAAGAFVYYSHKNWQANWGGEFLVSSENTKKLVYPKVKNYEGNKISLGSHIDSSFEDTSLLEEGVGRYIMPKPNRLVFLTSGVLHCIKKVDPSAGQNIRSSVQGFFLNPDKG